MSSLIFIDCPMCGTQMGMLARHCSQCGTRLPAPANPPTVEQQIEYDSIACTEKNHKLMKDLWGAKFCPVCNAHL